MTSEAAFKALRTLCLLWLLGLAAIYVAVPPYWSFMDDGANLELIHSTWSHLSWGGAVREGLARDSGYGMYRPVYFAYAYVYYGLFQNWPALGYGLLALAILALLAGWAVLFRKITQRGPEHAWLFFLLACVFTPHFNLFFHASLLEKFVLISGFGMMALAAADQEPESGFLARTGRLALLFVFAAVGFLAKPTTVFLWAPVVATAALTHPRRRSAVFITFATLLFAGFGFYFLSMRSGYTSDYDFSLVAQRLRHPDARFAGCFLIGLAGLVPLIPSRSPLPSPLRFRAVVWPLGLLSFLAVMLPWKGGINSYYLAPGGVFIIGCLVQAIFFILDRVPAGSRSFVRLVFGLVLIGLMAHSGRVFFKRLETHHHLRTVAAWMRETHQNAGSARVSFYVPAPCEEEALTLGRFSGIPVSVLKANTVVPAHEPAYAVTLPSCILTRPGAHVQVQAWGGWSVVRLSDHD